MVWSKNAIVEIAFCVMRTTYSKMYISVIHILRHNVSASIEPFTQLWYQSHEGAYVGHDMYLIVFYIYFTLKEQCAAFELL